MCDTQKQKPVNRTKDWLYKKAQTYEGGNKQDANYIISSVVTNHMAVRYPVHIYTTAGLITQVSWSRIHGSELVMPQLRPSASPCGRWCRHRPIAAPIHSGFSHRCCIAPRIRQPSAVSLTAAMGSCLWGNQIPQSGSQLQIHKGIWNVIQLKFIWAPPSSKRRNVKIRTQITKQ